MLIRYGHPWCIANVLKIKLFVIFLVHAFSFESTIIFKLPKIFWVKLKYLKSISVKSLLFNGRLPFWVCGLEMD